ncbi:hypothetical protein Y032_0016g2994 [Ancylostoma ceylanicum]|uniref:Uncharacterized protein n=1 Tax=Ancylostoma ceylanicum TaxID=53326 RepID=A0A016V5X9_9BILA|nr:hypothetical protein Y032_0016g2994 [Ancylostoma ceylanicum]
MHASSELLLLAFLHGAVGRLLQINEWHEMPIEPGGEATLDLSLFMSCERFSMVIATEDEELNRLTFIFDGEDLRKVDVDSQLDIEIPSPPPVIGGCREIDRKFLRINLIPRARKLEVRLHEQVIIRPKRNSTEKVKILFPQKRACCLIRGILLTDDDVLELTPIPPRKQRPVRIRTEHVSSGNTKAEQMVNLRKTSKGDPFARLSVTSSHTVDHRLITDARIQPTPKPTTSVHEYQLISWTDMVNREWSISFLVCSIFILIIMVVMISFGFCMFVYLQTRPDGGKKQYTIED